MTATALRPRSPTEAVDAALRLATGHLGSWVAVNALIALPSIVYWALNFDAIATPQGMAVDHYRTFAILGVGNLVINGLATATVVAAMSEVYLGRELNIGAAFQRMLSRAPMLILAILLRWLLLLAGIVLFIVPGVYVGFRTVCLEGVAMIEPERRGPGGIFGRTWSLAEDHVGHLFLTMLLSLVIYLAGYAVSEVIIRVLGSTVPMMEALRSKRLVQTALLLFVQPILPATSTVLYYDLRVRKEALDLELMAGSLEAPAA
jgi:hypothetical protein